VAVARCPSMASMPKGRMGPPPRSLAVDAHDCIMVGSQGSTAYKVVARDRCYDLAGSPQIVVLPESCACTDPDLSANVELRQEKPPQRCAAKPMADPIIARHALSPSTPRAFRRDPSGFGGFDRSARPSRGACRAMNADVRPVRSRNVTSVGEDRGRVWRNRCLTTRAPYKDGTLLESGILQPRGCTVTHPTLESVTFRSSPFGDSNHTFRAAPLGTRPVSR
jgi:hypothetical protein